jgi:HAD superfamily hydrolase (TIGR01509 family)
MSKVEVVLLDVDGTLVDSNDLHAQAWLETFAAHGYLADFTRVRELIGQGGDKLIPEITGVASDSPEGRRLSEQRGHLFREQFLPRVRALPKAYDLLARFRRSGLRLFVASSAKEQELSALLAICGAADLVEHATSADDAPRSKPDPDIVQAALRKSGSDAPHALLLGDTPYDVAAGRKAGVGVVALRSGGFPDEALRDAIAIYDDTAHLLALYDQSPFAG